ncbi:hypothetical protein RIF29_25251 [Crotalaria pallida]|uniref:Uncharacterized protein n=1 Tax=Crotalaria pallida TaxID=3830 RepID=A0AAN9EM29_CROPI
MTVGRSQTISQGYLGVVLSNPIFLKPPDGTEWKSSNDDSVQILNKESPCKKRRLELPMPSLQLHKTKVEGSPNAHKLLHHGETKDGKTSQQKSLLISPCPWTTGNLEEAKKFTSENPFGIIKIKGRFMGKSYRNLPMAFVQEHITKTKRDMLIKFGNKLFPVKVIYYTSGSASLSAGLSRLEKESKMKAGDICVYELINRENVVLQLHIFGGHNQAIN